MIRKPSSPLFLAVVAATAAAGPDLIVGDLPATTHWGSVGDIHGYSLATTACNIGDAPIEYDFDSNHHPVFAQNLYRLSGGRFEQVGMSWTFNAFFALEQSHCGSCTPVGGGGWLGAGCSDPHSASVNGQQQYLAPRSEIDPSTGIFLFPPTGFGETGNAIDKRLQVHESDLTTPDATYFIEAQTVTPDDAAAGNQTNNASWRKVSVLANFGLSPTGATMREQPAIFAWMDAGAVVNTIDVPGDGRFLIGSLVTDNGDGTWSYEYAVQNLTSARAAGGFAVPISGSAVTAIGFHDVDHHTGEPFDGADWPGVAIDDEVFWVTDDYTSNPNANALRWGTLYNFRFVSDLSPLPGTATLTMFTPGGPDLIELPVYVPFGLCIADFNGDGTLNFFDIAGFLDAFSDQDPRADLTDDGVFDFFDVADYLALFSDGCP